MEIDHGNNEHWKCVVLKDTSGQHNYYGHKIKYLVSKHC